MPLSISISFRYPYTNFSLKRMASGGTVSSSKIYFIMLPYESLDNLGVVKITLSKVLGFLPTCASGRGNLCCFLFTYLQLVNDNL